MNNIHLDELLKLFNIELSNAINLDDLNNLKVKYLGRSGIINIYFKDIKNFQDNEKINIGKTLNSIKQKISLLLDDKIFLIKKHQEVKNFDVTLPGIRLISGSAHVLNKSIEFIESFFSKLGFEIVSGFEIDTDYYNFQVLNMPVTHPSRNMQDTFYIENNLLLRTHTSNMQAHIMESKKPPFKFLSCGKVYRRDLDISHTPMFHQVEGFIVDKNVSIANLKFILTKFLEFFFIEKIILRMRASYFPFTEPSMEIDIQCVNCYGTKCSICKYSGWVEVLGCGIIHPNVLKNCNINNKIYKGLAFGMGVERLSMIKYKINDIRFFFENNLEFLKQF